MAGEGNLGGPLGANREFTTTHWSVVVAAGGHDSPQAAEALETLCRTYWYPLYAYVRRRGYSPEDAEDLTQEFFARLLTRDSFARADPERGRFRSFLLVSLRHFLVDSHRHEQAARRGGGQGALPLDQALAEQRLLGDLCDEPTPEELFERGWARSLLEHAQSRLRDEYAAAGKTVLHDQLSRFPLAEKGDASFQCVAAALEMTESALKSAVHRMRARYRQLLREEVAHTLADPSELREEARHLIAVLGG